MKNAFLTAIFVIVAAVLAVMGTYKWTERQNSTEVEKMRNQIKQLEDRIEELKKNQTSVDDPSNEKQSVKKEEVEEGWQVYDNKKYNYQLIYPQKAKLSEASKNAFSLSMEDREEGTTLNDIYKEYTGKICITINHGPGTINISAPQNKNYKHIICGRSGVGVVDETKKKTDILYVDGKQYTAKGNEYITEVDEDEEETLVYHNETMTVTLDDNTQIQYGAGLADEDATWSDYIAIRSELVKIIESYKKTSNIE